jgi:acyl-coenzyme A thioesterase PaaI-like protein
MSEMEVRFDGHCFGCGPLNMDGLRLTFTPGPDGSVAEYVIPDRFQSWAGMTHGGVVALMLDEAVGWAAWHGGHPGVTGRLQVSYRRPLKLGEAVRIVGKVDKIRRTLVYVSACVENRDDHSRVADATATLMEVKTVVDPT